MIKKRFLFYSIILAFSYVYSEINDVDNNLGSSINFTSDGSYTVTTTNNRRYKVCQTTVMDDMTQRVDGSIEWVAQIREGFFNGDQSQEIVPATLTRVVVSNEDIRLFHTSTVEDKKCLLIRIFDLCF